MKIKLKYIFLFLTFFICVDSLAQVKFSFIPSPKVSQTLREKMNINISNLLSEITRAGMEGTNLNLNGLEMEEEAKTRLNALWDDAKFICNKTINEGICLEDYQGYQARDISITIKPDDPNYNQSLNRELTVSLNKNGKITGVRLAWEFQQSKETILNSASEVTDARERYEILKWIEDFRCYYNEKNLKALEQIYSDDALIITGSVVLQRKTSSDFNKIVFDNVNYRVQSKAEYIKKLSSIFSKNKRIKIEFDNIEVKRHGSKPNIYGVTLRQKWRTDRYHDEGWLFLLWDFNNPEYPQIYVRTWQPLSVREEERPNVYSFPYSN